MTQWVCLMYHDVRPGAAVGSRAADYFAVGSAAFEQQLDEIMSMGFRAISIEQAIQEGPGVESHTVACSFDDGDIGQFERAFPLLAKRGMAATFFITTGWVGRPGYISWEGLREMRAAGMSLQSHTRSHPFLSELGDGALREELHASRAELDAALGQRTVSIALPGGDAPRAALRSLIAEAGYTIVATSRWGMNRNRQAGAVGGCLRWVNRCTVRRDTTIDVFRATVRGDRLLAMRRSIREASLHGLRTALGPSRYARWRRGWLSATVR